MSRPNPNVARTYVDITLDMLEPVKGKSETAKSLLFYCPYCFEKIGKKDDKGKLYIYKTTLTGVCFRCNTYVTVGADINSDFDFSGLTLKRLESEIIIKTDILPIEESINVEALKEWYTDTNVFNYLINERGAHILQAADRCKFKAFKGKDRLGNDRTGVLIPFYIDDICVSYQIRYTAGYNGSRFFTKPGVRYLYSPGGLKIQPTSEITIGEGIFDSIALEYLGYPNPIGICGSNLSVPQLNTLKELAPEAVYLALDDIALSKELRKIIAKEFALVEKIDILTFGNKDPDDFVKEKIKIESYRSKAKDFIQSSSLQKATV